MQPVTGEYNAVMYSEMLSLRTIYVRNKRLVTRALLVVARTKHFKWFQVQMLDVILSNKLVKVMEK